MIIIVLCFSFVKFDYMLGLMMVVTLRKLRGVRTSRLVHTTKFLFNLLLMIMVTSIFLCVIYCDIPFVNAFFYFKRYSAPAEFSFLGYSTFF